MNIMKHMEAVFVVTICVAVSSSYLIDSIPHARAQAVNPDPALLASGDKMAVVTVSAKRLPSQQKLAAQA
jgi:hypothetical protein